MFTYKKRFISWWNQINIQNRCSVNNVHEIWSFSDNNSCKFIATNEWERGKLQNFNIYRLKHGRLFVAGWHLMASTHIFRYPKNVHAELTGMKLLCLPSLWWHWLHRVVNHNLFPAERIHVYHWEKFNQVWWTFIHKWNWVVTKSFDIRTCQEYFDIRHCNFNENTFHKLSFHTNLSIMRPINSWWWFWQMLHNAGQINRWTRVYVHVWATDDRCYGLCFCLGVINSN